MIHWISCDHINNYTYNQRENMPFRKDCINCQRLQYVSTQRIIPPTRRLSTRPLIFISWVILYFNIHSVTAFSTDRGSPSYYFTHPHHHKTQTNSLDSSSKDGALQHNHHPFLVTRFFMATTQDDGGDAQNNRPDDDEDDNKNKNPIIPNRKTNPNTNTNKQRRFPKSNNHNKGPSNQNNHTQLSQDTTNMKTSSTSKNNAGGKKKSSPRPSISKAENTTQLPVSSTSTTSTLKSSTPKSPTITNKSQSHTTTTTQDPQQLNRLLKRITQLEAIVASQSVELCRLREKWKELNEAASTFAQVVDILRQAGLTSSSSSGTDAKDTTSITTPLPQSNESNNLLKQDDAKKKKKKKSENIKNETSSTSSSSSPQDQKIQDDWEIFGRAPASVMDAADSAGASILAALLAGKHRMLVDVRDAELSRDPDILVQFIELAILPVAAGLEGLSSTRNRVKLVFPTVSQLLQYRRTMALAAPEVVALSTLGFDPVEKRDNLVVIIAPPPDDEEGLSKMNLLLNDIRPPVVVLNHHMVPMVGPASKFEQVYLLRLLTVQYRMGVNPPDDWPLGPTSVMDEDDQDKKKKNRRETSEEKIKEDRLGIKDEDDNAALEAAMEHAHEVGTHQGVTRAMVIRAYPKPWHIFVDTSPDTDADFEVAATFDECPSQDDINYAIVECLEGSEREDELVAQQMQQALETGQLNKVSEIFGVPGTTSEAIFGIDQLLDNADNLGSKDDGLFYDDWDLWKDTDTV